MEDVYFYRDLKLLFILGYRIYELDDHQFHHEKGQAKKMTKGIVKQEGALDKIIIDYMGVVHVIIGLAV